MDRRRVDWYLKLFLLKLSKKGVIKYKRLSRLIGEFERRHGKAGYDI